MGGADYRFWLLIMDLGLRRVLPLRKASFTQIQVLIIDLGLEDFLTLQTGLVYADTGADYRFWLLIMDLGLRRFLPLRKASFTQIQVLIIDFDAGRFCPSEKPRLRRYRC